MLVRGSDLRAEIATTKGLIEIIEGKLQHGFTFEVDQQNKDFEGSEYKPILDEYATLSRKLCALQVAQTAFNLATKIHTSNGEKSLALVIKELHFEQRIVAALKKIAKHQGESDYRGRPGMTRRQDEEVAQPMVNAHSAKEVYRDRLQKVNDLTKAIGSANAQAINIEIDEASHEALL